MKRFFAVTAALFFAAFTLLAQNDKADNILGTYSGGSGKDAYKVKITKSPDATYKATVCWVEDLYDENGNVYLDVKNPDKSLRNVRVDRIVLISGLKYNADKKNWGGAKIYDPQRGIKASVTCTFDNINVLKVRGTVLGIGETEVWTRVKE